jgi:hypothetical protein
MILVMLLFASFALFVVLATGVVASPFVVCDSPVSHINTTGTLDIIHIAEG